MALAHRREAQHFKRSASENFIDGNVSLHHIRKAAVTRKPDDERVGLGRLELCYVGRRDRLPPNLLDPIEVRVLGVLIEKESTTPEYYPLTLNSLVTACNQKSNRFPVTDYDDVTVTHALELLKQKRYAATIVSGGRAPKYAQRFSETLNMGRRELALMCTLMLRGAQTLGELSGRSERMHRFDDLSQVESVLDHLAEAEMVVRLQRGPGQKESRYAHLLCGEPETASANAEDTPRAALPDRFGALEIEVMDLRERVRRLEELLEN